MIASCALGVLWLIVLLICTFPPAPVMAWWLVFRLWVDELLIRAIGWWRPRGA